MASSDLATAMLLAGCSQEMTELEQVRVNKEKVEAEAKDLKYPYKEIKAYFESEDANPKVMKRIEEIPEFPLMDHVKGCTGASIAKAAIVDLEEVKEVNEFEPLEEWLTETGALFEDAFESGDEEVEFDRLGEVQEEIEKVKGLIPQETVK
ncbi:hypothetical protein [Planococcus sp. YIM B11945]|uniref:hypothetical protein n=1 Tax=Planococcus sp. YIM B11945 TaxID=3435410 RepID=UPI003D7CF534